MHELQPNHPNTNRNPMPIMKPKSKTAPCLPPGTDATLVPSIEISMLPEDGTKILNLLERFGVRREDDTPQEAATRLASMALALANIGSGHLHVSADGIECDLAMDFIIEGGMASADFINSVMEPISRIQDRCERILLYDVPGQSRNPMLSKLKSQQEQADATLLPRAYLKTMFSNGQFNFLGDQFLNKTQAKSEAPASTPADKQFTLEPEHLLNHTMVGSMITEYRNHTLLREVLDYPLFFSRVSATSGLQGHASKAHLGRQMIHAEIDSAAALVKMRKSVEEIGGRTKPGANGSPAVRLNLALSAGAGLLDEAVAVEEHLRKIIPELLWLVESAPACDLPDWSDDQPDASEDEQDWSEDESECPVLKFHECCGNEVRKRISFKDEDMHPLKALDGKLAEWRRFLREQERHLPGIAKTAFNLPAALCYGLEALHEHETPMDGDEVIAFARWLVLRMQNRVAVAMTGMENARIEKLAPKLAEKLAISGPMKVRQLVRKCSHLPTADCRAVLDWLAARGIAGESNGVWGILGDAEKILDAPAWSERQAS